jgi:hypothetical protein
MCPKAIQKEHFFFTLGIDDYWDLDVMRMYKCAKENGGSSLFWW